MTEKRFRHEHGHDGHRFNLDPVDYRARMTSSGELRRLDGEVKGFAFFCPCGCGLEGWLPINVEHGWQWDGNEERPTLGARPYAFRFFTMARGEKDFEPKTTKNGNLYYLGGRLRTLAQVEADNDPKEDILRSNMRCNKIAQVITNDNSWRFTGLFDGDDVLLDVTLPPLKKTA